MGSPSLVDAVAGLTSIFATICVGGGGGSLTVRVAEPDISPEDAVISVEPVPIPLASPFELIVATDVLLLVQENVTSGTTMLSAVRAVAVNCLVLPLLIVAEPGLTVMEFTTGGGSSTVTMIGSLVISSIMAVMSAMPAPTALTSPVISTVATSVSSLDHSNFPPPIIVPSEVRATAINWWVSPTTSIRAGISIREDMSTTMLATSGGISWTTTATGMLVMPSADAVIIAVPAAIAVTSPVSSIVATSVSSLDHVYVTSDMVIPSEVNAVAINWNVPPTSKVIVDGLTSTRATMGVDGSGSFTVTVTGELVIPSAAALIIDVPAPTAVATPDVPIFTTEVSLLVHVKPTLSRSDPPRASAVAVNVSISPMFMVCDDGSMVMVTTGESVTVIVTGVLDIPLPVARIVAVPAATAVARPEALMVTTLMLLLDQEMVTPLTVVPSEERADAENCCVPPTSRDAEEGVTDTLETVGAGGCTGFVGESSPPQPKVRINTAPKHATR